MKRTLIPFLLLGLVGACGGGEPVKGDPGERGDKGEPGTKGDPGQVDPALQVITPQALFAGRTAVLQIGGVGTTFAAGSTVDFGDPAVKVQKVELGSQASLRVTVEVGTAAKIGAHDVTVSSPAPPTGGQGPEQVKLKGGFTVMASLLSVAPMGMMTGATAEQGGFAELGARNLDYRDNPFYTGARIAGPFLQIGATTTSATAIAAVALVDALTPAGTLQTQVTTVNPLGQTVAYVSDPADPAAVKVKARAATALTAGMTKTGEMLAERRATNLYKLTTTADNQTLLMSFGGLGAAFTGAGAGIVGAMAPSSGHFGDGASVSPSVTVGMMGVVTAYNSAMVLPKAGDYYFTVYASDQSGSMNHSYAVTARTAATGALGSLKEPMMADTPATPLGNLAALDKPYYGTDGAIDAAYDSDYIKFKANKTGRVYVSVTTTPGVRIGVGIRQSDCTMIVAGTITSSSGTVGNEADVTDGGTYCVRVAGDATTAPYQLLIVPAL